VRIEVRVGDQGKLFGSVTARDIAEALHEATRVELEHRQVDLKEPIRELGSHDVTVKLTRNVLATVTVNVEALGGAVVGEETEESQAEAEPEAPAGEEEAVEEFAIEDAEEDAAVDASSESSDGSSEPESESDSEQS